jgi:phosphatidylinositol alpha-mannosyltransferase
MRIALVTEFYYPHLGGVTEHVENLATELNRMGHQAILVTSHMKGAPPDGPHVRRVGTSRVFYSNGAFTRLTSGWRLRSRIETILREERVDLVHVQGGLAPVLGLVAPAAAHRLDLPVVATFHSWFPRSAAYRLFRHWLQRELDRHAAAIAVSQPVIEANSRYVTAKWDVIPNGVNVGLFYPNGRRSADALEGSPRLLFLGRLDPRNGLDTLLAAMPRVLGKFPRAQLTVVGDGPLRARYYHLAQPLGDRVKFVGQVYHERRDYYATSDLYLCPTRRASFGITLLEAMACGRPIVASDIIGFRELVGPVGCAELVPAEDAGAWADAVTALLADPGRREAMGAVGLAASAQYAWPRIAQQVLDVYRRVTR